MDDNNRKGQFGVAYVNALAAAAGYMTYKLEPDMDGVDLGISARSKDISGAPSIELQIKTYSHLFESGEELSYFLRKKNYNDLRCKTVKPRYLVVVTVPRPDEPWVVESHYRLTLFYSAYFLSLKDFPALKGKTGVTVKIPRAQLFTIEALHGLMRQASHERLFHEASAL